MLKSDGFTFSTRNLKKILSFQSSEDSRNPIEDHQIHIRRHKIFLGTIFLLSFIYSTVDSFYHLGVNNEDDKNYLIFMLGAVFQFLRLLFAFFYLKKSSDGKPKSFALLEKIFIMVFSAGLLSNWNLQLTIDPSRAYVVGLEAGWNFLYVQTLFGQWPWKAVVFVSTSLFGMYRVIVSSEDSVFGIIQAGLQIVLVLMTTFIEEKQKNLKLLESISLEKAEQTFWNILNSLPDNIAILDLSGNLKFYNEYFDISFKVSENTDNSPIDVFSEIYQIKPRDRHLNLKKIQERHNFMKPMPRKSAKPFNKSNRQSIINKQGQNNLLVRYLTEEHEFTNNKGGSILGLKDFKEKLKSNTQRRHSQRQKTLTEFFNSITYFRDLQEVLDFFCANVDIIRTYTERENNFFIFDGKYNTSEGLVKSYEIKILLSSFEDEENFVVILRDTTHRDIIVTLEDNNNFKDGVLSSISHELRTPLNTSLNLLELAINGYSKFNKKNVNAPHSIYKKSASGSLINDLKDVYLVPAHKSGKLLESLINDIVDYSMLIGRKFVPNIKEKYLLKSLDKIRYLCEFQARKKNLEFHISLSQELKYKIRTDHRRLRQILTNLLNNAIRFTYKGFVSLRIEPCDENPSLVKFIVRDSGIGIEEEALKRMTSILENGDFQNKLNKQSNGLGMGLIISHHIARELGPRASRIAGIKIESKVGLGSKFWFLVENWTILAVHSRNGTLRQYKSDHGTVNSQKHSSFTQPSTGPFKITTYHTNPVLSNLENQNDDKLQDNEAIVSKDLDIEEDIACMIKDDNLKMQNNENKLLKKEKRHHTAISRQLVTGLLNRTEPVSLENYDFRDKDDSIRLATPRSSSLEILKNLEDPQTRIMPDSLNDKIKSCCSCPKILVVDDDMFNLFTMENLLAVLKFRIAKATNGEEAIKVVKRRCELKCSDSCQVFRLIFMDLSMPIMDGFQATLKLREMMKNREVPEIPIVACTAFVDPEKMEKCYECGMEGRICKPVNQNKLKEILKKYNIIEKSKD